MGPAATFFENPGPTAKKQYGEPGTRDPSGWPPLPAAQAPKKPKMGDLLMTDAGGAYVAVVGGKPKPDWSGLDKAVASPIGVGEMRHRPTSASVSAKLYYHRTKGLVPVFTKGSNFGEFVAKLQSHLETTGMDTIAYVRDPEDPSRVLSCVADYPTFNPRIMTELLQGRFDKYDPYDRRNDDDAVRYLLKSVDEPLQHQLQALADGQPFAQYFAELVDIVRRTAPDQVELVRRDVPEHIQALRAMIVATKPSGYRRDSVDEMWNHVKPLVDVLIACEWFDHSITKELAFTLLAAGGSGAQVDYYRQICTFITLHHDGVHAIRFLKGKDREEYMTKHKLMPKDLFEVASRAYQELCNAEPWPHTNAWAPHHSVPPHLFTTGTSPPTDVQASSNLLLQAMSPYFKLPDESSACYTCGSTDHFMRNCPKLNSRGGSRSSSSRRSNNNKCKAGVHEVKGKIGVDKSIRTAKNAWKLAAPDPNEPQEMIRNCSTFFWCATCKRWSTSHSTASHIKKTVYLCHDGPPANS